MNENVINNAENIENSGRIGDLFNYIFYSN